jgi:L-fuconolactonase
MIQDIADDNWMLNDALEPAFDSLIQLGLCFDALVKPRHLKQLLNLVNRYPSLKIVIDHAAKPNIEAAEFDQWAQDISSLAEKPNVYCKLSGLVTEAGHNPNFDILIPYMRHLLNTFGASKLMWGSDWPVLNLATDYTQWVSLTEAFLTNISQQEQTQIWSQTAIEFYHLQHLA